MNEGPNALFADEYGRPYGAADVPRPRVNALFAPWAPAAGVPSGQASLDALLRASPGWRSGQSGQAYLDSVLSRPAAAPRPAGQLARLGLDADAPAVPEPVHDAPVMPEAGRAYRDAALAALPENPGGGHRWTFLPLSHDADGTMHVAVPGAARDLAMGGADLLDAFANATGRTDFWGNPLPATVTPQATLALMAAGGLGAPAEAAGALMAGGSRGGAVGASAAGSVAKFAQVGYNRGIARTPEVAQRPFAADYPGMAADASHAAAGSKLATDIEGRPLVAQTVVGRQVVGGPDVALSTPSRAETDVAALAEALSGAPSRVLPHGHRDLGGGLGSTVDPTDWISLMQEGKALPSNPPYLVSVSDAVPEGLRPAVMAHETLGHVIDMRTHMLQRMSLSSGVRRELFTVYDALARRDPLRADIAAKVPAGQFATPETFKYRPHQVAEELLAEALRGYAANPNWFKTVAPRTAAQIREIANSDPFVSKIIQFNSAGDPIAAAAVAAAGQVSGAATAPVAGQDAPMLVDDGTGLVPSPITPTPAAPSPVPFRPRRALDGRLEA